MTFNNFTFHCNRGSPEPISDRNT